MKNNNKCDRYQNVDSGSLGHINKGLGYIGEMDDMMHPTWRCRRFERRYDFSTFNMADYTSCENCRHLSADNRCMVQPKLM